MFVNNALKMNGGQFINNIKGRGGLKLFMKRSDWTDTKQKSDEENIIIHTTVYC